MSILIMVGANHNRTATPETPASQPPIRRLKPVPDRAGLKGILFVLRNGIPWNALPRTAPQQKGLRV